MEIIKKSLFAAGILAAFAMAATAENSKEYVPAPENLEARQQFADNSFGVFIHWGIYSMFGQGEWYLNDWVNAQEYAKAAKGFYPDEFNAEQWVSAIKDSGAKYICITSRHHDGFSMFHTAQSDFNIVDATPFKRDIIKELADECHKQGIKLHFYYSHLDWSREDYPLGNTGHMTGRDESKADFDSYYNFMNAQLTELLTNYGEIGAIWFDGMWDHDVLTTDFDWRLEEQYALIHSLQPACLIGNNHHLPVFSGEDIQIFEKDLPGNNTAGFSANQKVCDTLPLETCETMNNCWGYNVKDYNYKDTKTLIHLLVKTSGMGANLLLNVGPQPSGALPQASVDRLKEIGEWMNRYGETIYATTAGDFPAQSWGTTTRKGNKLYVHVLSAENPDIELPLNCKVKKAVAFDSRQPVKFTADKKGGKVTLHLGEVPDMIDYIVELETASK